MRYRTRGNRRTGQEGDVHRQERVVKVRQWLHSLESGVQVAHTPSALLMREGDMITIRFGRWNSAWGTPPLFGPLAPHPPVRGQGLS